MGAMGSPTEHVVVLGLWHLGSVVAAGLAELGWRVTGLDFDAATVARLRDGHAPVHEPGLDELIGRHLVAGRLDFTDNAVAVADAAYLLVTYDTPVRADDSSDCAVIINGLCRIAPLLPAGCMVVISSQMPVGTSEDIERLLVKWRAPAPVCPHTPGAGRLEVAYVPENLRLGEAIDSFLHPERIVVGADTPAAEVRVRRLLAGFGVPLLVMSRRSAEMAKHALNAFLATSISFANELATIAECVGGVDIVPVIEALRSDPRIGRRAYLQPGVGFAGGTLARDVRVLLDLAASAGRPATILPAILSVNHGRRAAVLERLRGIYQRLDGLDIAVYGLTYKPNTSTLRRSVAVELIGDLRTAGARVAAYDPQAAADEVAAHAEFTFVGDPYELSCGKDAALFVTEWEEFRRIDFRRLGGAMKRPVIVDARNMLDMAAVRASGCIYLGIGREACARGVDDAA